MVVQRTEIAYKYVDSHARHAAWIFTNSHSDIPAKTGARLVLVALLEGLLGSVRLNRWCGRFYSSLGLLSEARLANEKQR